MLLTASVAHAQNSDSLSLQQDSAQRALAAKKAIYSEARKASIMSAIVPGLGQGYNRKYWKIPLIYGAMGGFAYVFASNNSEYRYYRKNLIAYYDNDSTTKNTSFYEGQQLKTQKDYYKKLRDIGIIGMGIVYLLNIVDANVDAHLKTFDVSDDIGMQLDPFHIQAVPGQRGAYAAGISIKLNFR